MGGKKMSTIIKALKERNAHLAIEYYGIDDLATGWDVKAIVENSKFIINYFSSKESFEIKTKDDYVDYLIARKIVDMQEVIPRIISEENKTIMSDICVCFSGIIKEYSTRDLIKFIDNNIEDIFDRESSEKVYGIEDLTLHLCAKYQSGLDEKLFVFLINNRTYALLHRYDEFQRIIESKSKLKASFFSKITEDVVLKQDLENVIKVILILQNGKRNSKTLVEQCINRIIKYGEELASEINETNIIYYDVKIRIIYDFLTTIGNIKANDFKEYVKKAEELMTKYLEKNGHEYKFEVPLDEVMKLIDSEMPWHIKLLNLTHTMENETKEKKSVLDFAPREKGIVDLVSSNIPTNEYFTFSHQQMLDMVLDFGGYMTFKLLSNIRYFNECMNTYGQMICFISEELGCMQDNLFNDFELLSQMLHNYFHSEIHDGGEKEKIKYALCYAPAMFCCSFLEKLLRTTYIVLKKEQLFIPANKATLGNLLSDENDDFKKILGEYQLKHLRYFLCTDDVNIGYNLRNKLAHWNDMTTERLTNKFLCQIVYLLSSVIGSLFLFAVEQQDEKEKKDEQ